MTGRGPVAVVTTGRCLAEGCGWSAQGPWVTVDGAADKHTRANGHATAVTTGRYPTPSVARPPAAGTPS